VAVDYAFGIPLRRQLGAMDDALAAKPFGIHMSLGDVITVRQEDVLDTAQFLEPSNQIWQVFWRVDEPVAGGMLDDIAMAAIGLRRIEPGVIHTVFEMQREIVHEFASIVLMYHANRSRRAGQQGAHGFVPLLHCA
jgi:hypothetical protein